MTIIITSEKLIKEIQEEFTALFPFLRIEFFTASKDTVSKISNLVNIGEAYNTKELVTIEISPYTTVKDFEHDFESKFGACAFAQLYRKSGSTWQEITITDTWTLKQQDETGNEISTLLNSEDHSKNRRNRKTTLV